MEGKIVIIGGRDFSVPKLRVGTLRRVTGILKEIDGLDPKAPDDTLRWFDAHSRAILELLQRNYPEMQREDLEDLIDADGVVDVFMAVMAAAGRRMDAKGEAVSP